MAFPILTLEVEAPWAKAVVVVFLVPAVIPGATGTYVGVIGVWYWMTKLSNATGLRAFFAALVSYLLLVFIEIWLIPDIAAGS